MNMNSPGMLPLANSGTLIGWLRRALELPGRRGCDISPQTCDHAAYRDCGLAPCLSLSVIQLGNSLVWFYNPNEYTF